MPFYLEMSKNATQQRDIYDTVIFRLLQIFYIYTYICVCVCGNHIKLNLIHISYFMN